ncbi:MAG: L-asparaginase 2 [Opitutus sp.]|nr:L-asparaginase 2 [Opitutus sp.]
MSLAPTLPRLRVLATGGTIAGAQTKGTRGYQAAAFSVEALIAAVPQLEVEQVAALGSQDMDESTWRKLAARTQAALDSSDIAAVVITHGTDTMEETAFFLNLVVRSAQPVVLVGAMRPATAISADGPMNLYNAVAVAAHAEARGRGVLVVANDEIHFAREVAKTNTTQVGTFRATARGLAGLVLAGVGDGNLGAVALAAAAEAAKNGVAVVRSSRTGGGVVERNLEIDDDRHGFIVADELNPQKARVLLMLGLTRTCDVGTLQEMFFTY